MNPQINSLIHQAIQHFQNGNLANAEALLKKVLQRHPKNFDALHIMGVVYGLQNKHAEAKELFRKAIRINPDNNFLHFNLAKALSESGDDIQSIPHHIKATQLAPNDQEAWLNYGKSLHHLNEHTEALTCYDRAINIDPNYAEAWSNQGASLNELERHEEALVSLETALQLNPLLAEAWANKGNTLKDLKRYDEALAAHDQAIRLKPDYAETYSNKGNTLNLLERHSEALEAHNRALKLNPGYAAGWSNKGATLSFLGRHDEALEALDQALKLNPGYAAGWSNKGGTLNTLKRYDEALAHYDQAIQLKPDYAEAWSNKGGTLNTLKRYDEALAHYDQAIRLKPDYAEAWSNKGITLDALQRYDEALAHYDQAIRLKPDYAEAWFNKGGTLCAMHRYDEALAHYDQAIRLKPDYAEAWSNKGVPLYELKRYDEALVCYEKALSLKPDIDYLFGNSIYLQLLTCNWVRFEANATEFVNKVQNDEKAAAPFISLSIIDSPELQLKAAETWVKERYPANLLLPPIPIRPDKKIRLGYFSADFRNHPVSLLTAELFETHDRNRFEIFAFSLGQADQDDETRKRLTQAFDQFVDVQNQSDLEIAKLSRDLGIDIAVDLGGHTKDCRTAIFAYRAAPIQVNYLGYSGTMGAEYIDYIIADHTLIPESNQKYFSEKIIYLPNSYQVNDSKREISSRKFTRSELGLPETGFVFCCFNSSYKITPTTFDSWMRILQNADTSILWLSEGNAIATRNLQQEAVNRGVPADRLVFAKRMELLSEHLARHRVADLFLDTLPYNAHTTTSDALWAGLPALTLLGQTYAGRVAASLLKAVGLPELITQTREEYESLAIELAHNPDKLNQIGQTLIANRLTTPLFDTQLFTRHIEAAYRRIYERYQAGLPPDHILVER